MKSPPFDIMASIELELAIRDAVQGRKKPLDEFLRSGRFLRLQPSNGELLADYVSGKIRRARGKAPDEAVLLAVKLIKNAERAAKRRGVRISRAKLAEHVVERMGDRAPDPEKLQNYLDRKHRPRKSAHYSR
jgi:hypothetical protein